MIDKSPSSRDRQLRKCSDFLFIFLFEEHVGLAFVYELGKLAEHKLGATFAGCQLSHNRISALLQAMYIDPFFKHNRSITPTQPQRLELEME